MRHSPRARRGAAVVEFALVVPLLFMLLLGIIEFGRTMMVYQVINNAARQGARQAVLGSSTVASVNSSLNDLLTSTSITGATVTINGPNGAVTDLSKLNAGDSVTVTVSVPYSRVSWLPKSSYLDNVTLTCSTVMRRE